MRPIQGDRHSAHNCVQYTYFVQRGSSERHPFDNFKLQGPIAFLREVHHSCFADRWLYLVMQQSIAYAVINFLQLIGGIGMCRWTVNLDEACLTIQYRMLVLHSLLACIDDLTDAVLLVPLDMLYVGYLVIRPRPSIRTPHSYEAHSKFGQPAQWLEDRIHDVTFATLPWAQSSQGWRMTLCLTARECTWTNKSLVR